MRARLPRIGPAALLVFSSLSCQSEPGVSTDDARSIENVGPVTTGTAISIEDETSTFFAGDTITLRAEVTPAPDGGIVLFFPTNPLQGPGAPAEDVVDGVATRKVVCGSDRVPFGSHTAQAHYQGTDAFLGGSSTTISYECLAGD